LRDREPLTLRLYAPAAYLIQELTAREKIFSYLGRNTRSHASRGASLALFRKFQLFSIH